MTPIDLLVIHVAPGKADTPIGEVRIDEAGLLTLLGASPAQASYLQAWVERLNARDAFTLKVAPPAGTDAPMLSIHGRRFSRTEPGFIQDLKAYVRQMHGLKLLTPAELAQDIEELAKGGL